MTAQCSNFVVTTALSLLLSMVMTSDMMSSLMMSLVAWILITHSDIINLVQRTTLDDYRASDRDQTGACNSGS